MREQNSPGQHSPHNNTTYKHLNSRHSFQVPFEREHEKEDDEVNVESTLTNTFKNINTAIRFSPDREMLKQIRSFDVNSQQKIRIIADEYYNYAIFHKTSSFLDDIKTVILFWEEKLRLKRREAIEQTTYAIKQQWAEVRDHLINLVTDWCLSSQKYEIASFLERSQLKMDGALLELLGRLGTKRQEIEQHMSQIVVLSKEEEVLRGEELSSHMKQVKRYYQHIWNRDYQFQVENLEKECISKLSTAFIYEKIQPCSAQILKQQLQANLDHLFYDYFHLVPPQPPQSPQSPQQPPPPQPSQAESIHHSNQPNSTNPPLKTGRKIRQQTDQPIQSSNRNMQRVTPEKYEGEQSNRYVGNQSPSQSEAIAQKRRLIQRQRLERDKEWIILVQGLDNAT